MYAWPQSRSLCGAAVAQRSLRTCDRRSTRCAAGPRHQPPPPPGGPPPPPGKPPPPRRLLPPPSVPFELLLEEPELPEFRDGNVVVTTSWSPALSPLTICVRLSPLSPTTTCWETVLPLRDKDTVASEPLP